MVSDAVQRVNKQMAQIDSSSTVAMLERMRDKVVQSEALAEAYSEIADENKSLDQEIDSALGDDVAKASDALTALKERMGILPKTDF